MNGIMGFSRKTEIPGRRFTDAQDWVVSGDSGCTVVAADRLGGGIVHTVDATDNDESWVEWGGEKFSFRAGTRIIAMGEVDYAEANTNDKNFFLGFGEFQADMFTDSDVFIASVDAFGFVKHKDDLLLDAIYSDGGTQTLTSNIFSGGLAVSTTYKWGIMAKCHNNDRGDIALYWDLTTADWGNFFERATPVATFTNKDLQALNLMSFGLFQKNGAGNAESLTLAGYLPRMIG